jgi:hypothetical protein
VARASSFGPPWRAGRLRSVNARAIGHRLDEPQYFFTIGARDCSATSATLFFASSLILL